MYVFATSSESYDTTVYSVVGRYIVDENLFSLIRKWTPYVASGTFSFPSSRNIK